MWHYDTWCQEGGTACHMIELCEVKLVFLHSSEFWNEATSYNYHTCIMTKIKRGNTLKTHFEVSDFQKYHLCKWPYVMVS